MFCSLYKHQFDFFFFFFGGGGGGGDKRCDLLQCSDHSKGGLFTREEENVIIFMCEDIMFLHKSSVSISLVLI